VKGREAHEYFQQIHCRPRRESAAPGGGDDHADLPQLRADLHAPGERPALAGLLPCVQGKASVAGDSHTYLPQLRAQLHLFHTAAALAEILPVLQDKAQKVKSKWLSHFEAAAF
jgi:hypothetical protein